MQNKSHREKSAVENHKGPLQSTVEEIQLFYSSVFEYCQESIIISDANECIIDVNPAFTKATGYTREEVLGKSHKMLSSGRQSKAVYAAMRKALNASSFWRGEIWNRRKNGEIYAELLTITTITNMQGKMIGYLGVSLDISDIKEHEAELIRVAHYDPLTSMPNRALLVDRMKQAIAQTKRDQTLLAVCYLDLDGFKPINDEKGHDFGDKVLVEVARRIKVAMRGGDTIARLGGDEFVLLLLGLEKGEECQRVLQRMLTVIEEPIAVEGEFITLSASIGVSIYPLDESNQDILLRHADQAMFVAKQLGKNRFHIFDPSLDKKAQSHNAHVNSIRLAVEQNQFELYYQPKINLRTYEIVGAEALIRWQHPERGLLSPAEFLPYIENTDVDIDIGNWVIEAALKQVNIWSKAGFDIEVSINISAYHLEAAHFLTNLQRLLELYPDMPNRMIQIEVLESAALNDFSRVQQIIEACRGIGIRFALDDFGTGYSSLTYLNRLPVDEIKVDQSFVRDMLEDKGDMAIVQGVIALANAFNRQIVAEGIETVEHFPVLLRMGCEVGQGYGIARPMPADQLVGWRFK